MKGKSGWDIVKVRFPNKVLGLPGDGSIWEKLNGQMYISGSSAKA